jgi:hypothetical protein
VQGAAREIVARWARLSTAVVFPQKGHYPRTGALILFNKIITDLVFPRGFFQGFYPKSRVQCVMVSVLIASADFLVKT